MKTNILLGLVVFAGSALWAADTITPLDVKLGQWESTMTSETTGLPPIPQELLDRLPPEQRAKMEERLKANASKGPKTTVNKSCLKKEDLDKALSFGSDGQILHAELSLLRIGASRRFIWSARLVEENRAERSASRPSVRKTSKARRR